MTHLSILSTQYFLMSIIKAWCSGMSSMMKAKIKNCFGHIYKCVFVKHILLFSRLETCMNVLTKLLMPKTLLTLRPPRSFWAGRKALRWDVMDQFTTCKIPGVSKMRGIHTAGSWHLSSHCLSGLRCPFNYPSSPAQSGPHKLRSI